MTALTSSLIVRLIDQVTGPARGVEESLQRINRAGGTGPGAAPSFADNMAAAQARVSTAIVANNRALDTARLRVADAVAGYFVLDRTIGSTVRVAGDFQEAMNRVAVVSRANSDELAALNQQARELGRTTQFTASQVADGMGFLAMAGFDAQQVMASMPATLNLAAAGGMELGRSDDIVSNILTGYGLQVEDLERVTDSLVGTFTRTNTNLDQLGTAFTYAGPLARSAGMDFNETAAILGRLGDAGYQGSLGGTALRGAIIRLLAPTTSAAELMSELDVAFEDIAEEGESLEGILGDAEEAMRQIGLQVTDAEGRMLPFVDIMRQLERHADDAGLMARLFGARAGPAMAALLRQGSASVRELTEELGELDGEAARVAEERLRGYNGSMRAFRSAIEGVQIAIGTALLPALTKLIGRLTDLMKPVTDFLEANPRLTAAIVGTAAAMVSLKIAAAGLTFVGLLGKGGALSLLAGGLRAITFLGTPVAGFFETLAMRNALATRSLGRTPGLLARIGDAARVLVRSIPGVGLLGKGLALIGTAVAGITAPVWAGIAAGVMAVVAGGALLWRYWDRVSAVLGGVGRRIMEELQPAFEALRPVLDFISPALDLIGAAASAVGGAFVAAGQAIRDFIGWVGSFFEREVLSEEQAAAWGQSGYDAADQLIEWVKAVFNGFVYWVSGRWALDVFEAVTGINLYDAGEAAVETMKQAFWDFLDWLRGLPARVIAAIGTIDLRGVIRLPSVSDITGSVRGTWDRMWGGGEEAPSAHRASGGPVWPGSSFLVGEREPEIFTPRTGGEITPLSALERGIERMLARESHGGASGGGGGGTAPVAVHNTFNLSVTGADEPLSIARQVRAALEDELRHLFRGALADAPIR